MSVISETAAQTMIKLKNPPETAIATIEYIVKRDGRRARFAPEKIGAAIQKAFVATG
ncbi:MAG: hypothetical protein IJ991_09080, partial [Thermoguttaceae bacterium]|nr:hypothetical protein [Thermoguttaceae bacterium]